MLFSEPQKHAIFATFVMHHLTFDLPFQSEDIRLLKQEMETGYRNLEKVAMLRDECGLLAWKQEEEAQNRFITLFEGHS